ncbi:MAG: hypothetical protein JNL60_03760, partial [Bacteroidia bacterium]|nr:hypothetical protein [Bacteroidia bacterium]
MRNLFLIFLLFMYGNSISQTYAFYRIGQSPTQVESSGLLIRNYKRDLDKLSQLEKYKNLTCFKISGFKDNYEKLDSVLSMLARHTSPRALIFEDCDLMMLSKFEIKTLVKLSLLKNTLFYENSLFPLLKKNPLTTIEIQSSEIPVFDSLGLLKELKEVKLSNRNSFSTVNKTDKLFFKSGDKFINVSISYAGDFFKGEQKNKMPFNTQKINEQVKQTTEMIEQMSALRKLVRTNRPAYLRQPLPEISINDTGFVMDSRNTSYFNYNSGSVIKIDGNAFVTSEDEDYSGPVRIFYREFRNSVDIMLSGVPMNSMVNGEEKLFKSGGMYEIYAFDAKDRPLRA